ncbi:PilZ domain-containing protein [Pseudomonas citri]|uniref:PilZ domain-containing protein n=1 Tax=Pseudomonas citri TaxID=2978349 RepID=UPI0021B5FD77|nr:PilZ domain-containing protein [Pseudomonas citri]
MYKNRRIERQQLPYFLKVFNGVNDRPIGFLGNVSEDGLMLISHLPLLVGADFDLRLKIPTDDGGQQIIQIKANCLWCREDVTPQHFDAGFKLRGAVAPEYGQLVSDLQQYFSFHPLPASA